MHYVKYLDDLMRDCIQVLNDKRENTEKEDFGEIGKRDILIDELQILVDNPIMELRNGLSVLVK